MSDTIKTDEKYVVLLAIPLLEGDEEEVKQGAELKILTPKKLLTRLPIFLVQIKAGNNSYKSRNEIRKLDKDFIFCINIIKSLKKFSKCFILIFIDIKMWMTI